jgi:hypothetical protein
MEAATVGVAEDVSGDWLNESGDDVSVTLLPTGLR